MALGISRANAFIIKKFPAYIAKPTIGPKPKLTGRMKSCFYAKVSRGSFRRYKEAQEYLQAKYNLVTTISRMLRH